MKPRIEALRPLLIAVPIDCGVPVCTHTHEIALDLSQFSSDGSMLYLCRKHYEDFVSSTKTLP